MSGARRDALVPGEVIWVAPEIAVGRAGRAADATLAAVRGWLADFLE